MEQNFLLKPLSTFTKIHRKNLDLYEAGKKDGMLGQRHSKLIDKMLTQKQIFQNKKGKQMKELDQPSLEFHEKSRQLRQKVQTLTIQQLKLKRQMMRLCQISKQYKLDKKQYEQKYEAMKGQYGKSQQYIKQLQLKIKMLSELNSLLIEINTNVQPFCKINCNNLFKSISKVKVELSNYKKQGINQIIQQFKSDLYNFKKQVSNIKKYNFNLINDLQNINISTKHINNRLSLNGSTDLNQINGLYQQIVHLKSNRKVQFSKEVDRHDRSYDLQIYSQVIKINEIPSKSSKINKILQKISLLFQQQIHLLEAQKMQFQFTKNKKLISFQKFQCQICQNYEKIMANIFSIVREAFKQIKFQFLMEIKQLKSVDEVTLLI